MTGDTRMVAAFLRGLNVGGHRVKMDRLRRILSELDLGDPRTLLASGNVVFDASADERETLEGLVESGLREALGYEVLTFIRTAKEIERIAADPFADRSLGDRDRVHVLLLKRPATSAVVESMRELIPAEDDLAKGPREVFWLRRGPLMDVELSEPARLARTGVGPVTMRTMATVRRLAHKFFSS